MVVSASDALTAVYATLHTFLWHQEGWSLEDSQ